MPAALHPRPAHLSPPTCARLAGHAGVGCGLIVDVSWTYLVDYTAALLCLEPPTPGLVAYGRHAARWTRRPAGPWHSVHAPFGFTCSRCRRIIPNADPTPCLQPSPRAHCNTHAARGHPWPVREAASVSGCRPSQTPSSRGAGRPSRDRTWAAYLRGRGGRSGAVVYESRRGEGWRP